MSKPYYGGAFDIDPYQFWTREDLGDLCCEIEDRLSSTPSFYIRGSFIENNVIELDISYAGFEETIKQKIDMKKIQSPHDLTRIYAPVMQTKIQQQIKEYEMMLTEIER